MRQGKESLNVRVFLCLQNVGDRQVAIDGYFIRNENVLSHDPHLRCNRQES